MDTGISSARGWINLTTLLLRRFASLVVLPVYASVDPKGDILRVSFAIGFTQLASIPVRTPARRGIRPGMDDPGNTDEDSL